ncbi:peroxiredoxin [Larsenimonas suaedae]|uniref:thioredoxin-dependent peroxiredoxin n=1 Tax=Larsenimonas suaedae TaxID=1851019 RepID=A0ABU1GV68_9GAMM|nr:peroxiredoxin [Larsenimonas suaedae]MCM2971894.1 peroxiredoxin [Larsenimonas suaedae]MDR5895446.1 peroxiredoxin [Larsenimonas suaedae]
MTIDVGQSLPEFSVPATSELTVTPETLKGHYTVLYFYPKDSTPGCTTEGQQFRDLFEDFKALNAVIYGVSRDGLKAHENFRAKQSFPFELISDKEETLCRALDVIKLKKMYGKEHEGIERSTFVLDEQGVLIKEWRKVKADGHAQEVLEFLKQHTA